MAARIGAAGEGGGLASRPHRPDACQVSGPCRLAVLLLTMLKCNCFKRSAPVSAARRLPKPPARRSPVIFISRPPEPCPATCTWVAAASDHLNNLTLLEDIVYLQTMYDASCRKLWGELAKVGGLEGQAAARAQLQEVEPAIRYCSYRLGRADAADLAADMPASPAGDLLGVGTCCGSQFEHQMACAFQQCNRSPSLVGDLLSAVCAVLSHLI